MNRFSGNSRIGDNGGVPCVDEDDTLAISQSINEKDDVSAPFSFHETSSNDRSRVFHNNKCSPPNGYADGSPTTRKNLLSSDDSLTDLINDVTSPDKTGINCKILLEGNVRKDVIKNRMPDIFNAIRNEIGSMARNNRKYEEPNRQKLKPPRKQKIKSLSEVLESEESLTTAEYSIPRSMIRKETIDRLQTLVDRAKRKLRTGRFLESESRQVVSKEPERLRTPISYYTAIINENEPVNINASSSVVSGPICRICHGRQGTLVKPCRCRGTLAYVHVECLQVWLTEKEVNFCELCNYTFRVIHVPEYKIFPSIGFWYKFAATNQQRRTMMVDLTLAIILLPFIIFLTIIMQSLTTAGKFDFEEDEEFEDSTILHFGQATIKFAIFLIILLYIAGVLIRVSHHLSDWLSWYVNKNVTVVLEDRRQNGTDDGD